MDLVERTRESRSSREKERLQTQSIVNDCIYFNYDLKRNFIAKRFY